MVRVVGVKKSFIDEAGRLEVIREADFYIERGEMVALVGVSGAGKTTLLQLIGGLDRPECGSIEIGGHDIATLSSTELAIFRNRSIGFVFQFHHLLPDFNALENVIMPGIIAGMRPAQCMVRGRELLDAVGLSRQASHFPAELSGGERQRVALARALFNEPALVLADEPTGNLDAENSERLLELFRMTNRNLHQTFLVATHNDAMVRGMHRSLRIHDGRVKPD